MSHGVFDSSVNTWKQYFAPNQCFCLAEALMIFVSHLYNSGLQRSGYYNLSVPKKYVSISVFGELVSDVLKFLQCILVNVILVTFVPVPGGASFYYSSKYLVFRGRGFYLFKCDLARYWGLWNKVNVSFCNLFFSTRLNVLFDGMSRHEVRGVIFAWAVHNG